MSDSRARPFRVLIPENAPFSARTARLARSGFFAALLGRTRSATRP